MCVAQPPKFRRYPSGEEEPGKVGREDSNDSSLNTLQSTRRDLASKEINSERGALAQRAVVSINLVVFKSEHFNGLHRRNQKPKIIEKVAAPTVMQHPIDPEAKERKLKSFHFVAPSAWSTGKCQQS